jgi:hypothetical protein
MTCLTRILPQQLTGIVLPSYASGLQLLVSYITQEWHPWRWQLWCPFQGHASPRSQL